MTYSNATRTGVLAIGIVLAVAAGCSTAKPVYPVEGAVTYDDGKPAVELARGTVSLESVEDRTNAAGDIRADGSFRIRSPLGQDGVRPGKYRVIVLPPEGADRNRPPVDRHYGRYETSGIEVTVNEGENKLTIKVKRPNRGAAR
jgi:hypothetical protein